MIIVKGFALMGSFRGAIILASFLILGVPINAIAADAAVMSGTIAPTTILLLVVYSLLIALSSIFGGFLPLFVKLTHTRMQLLVSSVGGFMLGVGIFHQLPHAVAIVPTSPHGDSGPLDTCMWWLMVGLLTTFFMLRIFHFHSHEPLDVDDDAAHDHDHDCGHDHDHDHHHDHDHDHGGHGQLPSNNAGWIGIFLGLSLHTLLDGVALAAAVQADALHNHGGDQYAWMVMGIGTFFGIFLHKPLDSLSITSIMAASGWSRQSMQTVNFIYAVMCPIGALLFCLGVHWISNGRETVVASALAMSAGVFLCISLSDLLPEVQFHSHDRLKLSAALLVGVFLAWAIGILEPKHAHGRHSEPTVQGQVERVGHPNDQKVDVHTHEH